MGYRINQSLADSVKVDWIWQAAQLVDSMLHLLRFPKTSVLDLLAMLFYPKKVPSIDFDFLLDS